MLLGDAWGGVHASNTLPPMPSQELACRVCNTAATDDGTGGVHWVACVEQDGQRYFNDSLGEVGAQQRSALEQRYPDAQWVDMDAEQRPSQKDCGARVLSALRERRACRRGRWADTPSGEGGRS